MSKTQILATNLVVALVVVHAPLLYEKGTMAQVLSSTPVFEGTTTMLGKNGATQAVQIAVQSWAITGQEREIPLRGFYVAHLITGQISATVDGKTTAHLPGDYWTVKAGATMQVKVVGEVAVLETTVIVKE